MALVFGRDSQTMSASPTPEEPLSDRAYRRCPDGDRPTNEPGGMECMKCGCIFIGAEWHSYCRVCEEKRNGR
jgi:hypothetical protein